jgi:hypothetical protein
MPSTRIGSRPDQLEIDDQRDLVREREAALGQRGVPVEAVARAIDDRSKLRPILVLPYMSSREPT